MIFLESYKILKRYNYRIKKYKIFMEGILELLKKISMHTVIIKLLCYHV